MMSKPGGLIARFTMIDELRNKSFIVMIVLAALLMLLIRGCSGGSFVMNGQQVDRASVAIMVSKAQFHVISVAAVLLTALLAMGVLRRDRDAGVLASTLSRAVSRRQYLLGKVTGLWLLCAAVMIALHLLVFLLGWLSTPAMFPAFLAASLLCALNLLCVTLGVMALSLVMPEVVAFLAMTAVVGVGIVVEVVGGVLRMTKQQAPSVATDSPHPLWMAFDWLWPKLPGIQILAANCIGGDLPVLSGLYPLVNVLLWSAAFAAFLLWRFEKQDVV